MPWTRRHLITLEELSLGEIEQIHATAVAFKRTLKRSVKKVPALRGKTIVNLFLEPSTRTRMAFDMAAKRLSADVISVDAASSITTSTLESPNGSRTTMAPRPGMAPGRRWSSMASGAIRDRSPLPCWAMGPRSRLSCVNQ
jgi:hypothetical protein